MLPKITSRVPPLPPEMNFDYALQHYVKIHIIMPSPIFHFLSFLKYHASLEVSDFVILY